MDESSRMGPLINADQYEKVLNYIQVHKVLSAFHARLLACIRHPAQVNLDVCFRGSSAEAHCLSFLQLLAGIYVSNRLTSTARCGAERERRGMLPADGGRQGGGKDQGLLGAGAHFAFIVQACMHVCKRAASFRQTAA